MPIGKIKLKDTLRYSKYFWGKLEEIAGKEIWLMERNQEGNCLCLVENKGLVDVDCRDIEECKHKYHPYLLQDGFIHCKHCGNSITVKEWWDLELKKDIAAHHKE